MKKRISTILVITLMVFSLIATGAFAASANIVIPSYSKGKTASTAVPEYTTTSDTSTIPEYSQTEETYSTVSIPEYKPEGDVTPYAQIEELKNPYVPYPEVNTNLQLVPLDSESDSSGNTPELKDPWEIEVGMPDGLELEIDPDMQQDSDGDGIYDYQDNCVNTPNPHQVDFDNDGIGWACDTDWDNDGVPNVHDNCPIGDDFTYDSSVDTNPDQTNTDGDDWGDLCDPDIDGDGVFNDEDDCVYDYDPAQIDTDDDGIGDACDPVDDSVVQDEFPELESVTITPPIAVVGQETTFEVIATDDIGLTKIVFSIQDADDAEEASCSGTTCSAAFTRTFTEEGNYTALVAVYDLEKGTTFPHPFEVVDTGSDFTDGDGDGVDDSVDNCPETPNPDQSDEDEDGVGDACDPDFGLTGYDLRLVSVDVGPDAPDTSDEVSFDLTVMNDGTEDIYNFTVQALPEGVSGNSIEVVASVPSVLMPGDTTIVPLTYNYTYGGTYDAVFRVNYDDSLPEAEYDTADNEVMVEVVVAGQEAPEDDIDSDGIVDTEDNCVNTPNSDQADSDNDGVGNACDADDDSDDDTDDDDDSDDEATCAGDEDDADDAIKDAEDKIEEAEDVIDDAEDALDDGKDVSFDDDDVEDAKDDLDEAEDLLQQAKDKYDSCDYDASEVLAEEAMDLADDIVSDLEMGDNDDSSHSSSYGDAGYEFFPPTTYGSGSTEASTGAASDPGEDESIVVLGSESSESFMGASEEESMSGSGWYIPLLVIIVLLLIAGEIVLLRKLFKKEAPLAEEEAQDVAEYV